MNNCNRTEPQRPKEQADFIHSASGHLLEIVNDILDYSKLEFGKASLHQAPFTMQEVLDEVHGILKAKAEEKQLTWSLELDNGCRKMGGRRCLCV